MDPHIRPGRVVYRFFVDKMGGANSAAFIGDEGQIFYDPTKGDLRISDDVTPGGIPLLQKLMESDAGNTIINGGGGGSGNTSGGGTPLPGANTVVYNYTQMEALGIINYGNMKYGFQKTDHFGWVLLDGRSLNDLTADQRSIAVQLGWTLNVPNFTGYVTKMTGQNPGDTGGLQNNQYLMTQNQLPKVTYSGTTDESRFHREDHAGATLDLDGQWLSTRAPGSRYTWHTHNFSFDLNPGVQVQTNVENQYRAMNAFVYLGL